MWQWGKILDRLRRPTGLNGRFRDGDFLTRAIAHQTQDQEKPGWINDHVRNGVQEQRHEDVGRSERRRDLVGRA